MRVLSIYFISMKTPRLSLHSSIIPPTYSEGTIILAETIGSSATDISSGEGYTAGLSIYDVIPSFVVILYITLGAVVTRSRLNSRSMRSSIISIWRSPRNPQRKPKPSAILVSGSNVSEASLSCNLRSASRRSGYFAPSAG